MSDYPNSAPRDGSGAEGQEIASRRLFTESVETQAQLLAREPHSSAELSLNYRMQARFQYLPGNSQRTISLLRNAFVLISPISATTDSESICHLILQMQETTPLTPEKLQEIADVIWTMPVLGLEKEAGLCGSEREQLRASYGQIRRHEMSTNQATVAAAPAATMDGSVSSSPLLPLSDSPSRLLSFLLTILALVPIYLRQTEVPSPSDPMVLFTKPDFNDFVLTHCLPLYHSYCNWRPKFLHSNFVKIVVIFSAFLVNFIGKSKTNFIDSDTKISEIAKNSKNLLERSDPNKHPNQSSKPSKSTNSVIISLKTTKGTYLTCEISDPASLFNQLRNELGPSKDAILSEIRNLLTNFEVNLKKTGKLNEIIDEIRWETEKNRGKNIKNQEKPRILKKYRRKLAKNSFI